MDKNRKKIVKLQNEWKCDLTEKEFHILREKGTESAFTGEYYNNKEAGNYLCAGCGSLLFSSEKKYDSGSGWPSFWEPEDKKDIMIEMDNSLGRLRSEVLCSHCEGHLGHVFDDGPEPTGLRYCINSTALHFKKKEFPDKD